MTEVNNNPIKQHYVPKAYLKNFSFDDKGNLFALKIKSSKDVYVNHPTFPKERNVSSICYKENIYTIKTDELLNESGVESKYHIEVNSFEYEDRMNEIFDNLISNERISSEEAYEIAYIIMDIKFRNPRMRQKLVSFAKKQYAKESNWLKSKKNRHYKRLFKDLFRRSKDENYPFDLYNGLLLNKPEITIKYAKDLASKPFYLFKAPESKFFITNDNPGFSILPGGRIEDTHFDDFLEFIFPLKPQWLLLIDNKLNVKSENESTKQIIFKEATNEFVDYVNLKCLENCNEYIFSNNKETLREVKDLHTNSQDKFNKPNPPK